MARVKTIKRAENNLFLEARKVPDENHSAYKWQVFVRATNELAWPRTYDHKSHACQAILAGGPKWENEHIHKIFEEIVFDNE